MAQNNPDRGLITQLGPVTVDIPRSLGYFGGVGAAVALGVIDPPLAVFIAAIPVLKMLMNSKAPAALRFVGQVFDGASQPVGGDAEGTIRLSTPPAKTGRPRKA